MLTNALTEGKPRLPHRYDLGWLRQTVCFQPTASVSGRFFWVNRFCARSIISTLLATGLIILLAIVVDARQYLIHHLRALTHHPNHTGEMIGLNDYAVAVAYRLPDVELNLSGITYCRQSKTLYAITNDPERIYNLDLGGNCLREIPLIGFDDTEGISYLGQNRFAIVEEKNHYLTLVEIDATTTRIDRSNVAKSLHIGMKSNDNKGFEGVAYDEGSRSIYLINEKRPRQLMRISGLAEDKNDIQISLQTHLIPHPLFLNDLSGLHFDDHSRNLLFVSHESKMVSEVSLDGEMVSYLELEEGAADLIDDVAQAEGITMDEEGNIYIVSEPDLFYRFSPKNRHDGRGHRHTYASARALANRPALP